MISRLPHEVPRSSKTPLLPAQVPPRMPLTDLVFSRGYLRTAGFEADFLMSITKRLAMLVRITYVHAYVCLCAHKTERRSNPIHSRTMICVSRALAISQAQAQMPPAIGIRGPCRLEQAYVRGRPRRMIGKERKERRREGGREERRGEAM